MTWKKRIISIVLCLCALLCAASVRADAADHSHPICGASHTDVGDHTGTCDNVTWTAWDGGDITYDTNNVAYVYLSDNVTLEKAKPLTVSTGQTLYLCLNGHSLKSKAYYTISVSGTLVLCDCNSSGQNNGTISHAANADGSIFGADGIYVVDNAAFTMYGGTISNNDSRGVLVSGGTFTMYGGEISHNKCITTGAEGGGGVWVKNDGSSIGNFAMYGGKISNNTYKGTGNCGGGGVYASGTGDFIIQGGEITNNQCSYNAANTSNGASGGGLYISGKPRELKIENCTISNNTCDGEGGGIFAISSGESSITNCTISGNNATRKNSMGGGFTFQNSTFTLKECTITDNKTAGKGGAICLMTSDANLTLSSGLIFSGNEDKCKVDTTTTSGLTSGTANDVFLHTGAYLRLASDFSKTSTAAIVVTTYFTPSDNSYQKIAVDNRTTPDPTDFKYGNDDTAICTYTVTEGENKTVELRACKHSGAWKPNTDDASSGHWRKCTNCDTTETASHSGGEASCTKKTVCQVCNQPYGGLAAHDYNMTTWVKIDNDHHWHKCKNCNAIDESTKAPHSWDEGTVTTPPTCTAAGVKTLACTVCSATKKETILATGHAWDAEWSKDNDHHWHKCKNCDAITDLTAHVPGAAATETTPQLCTECGYVIAPATHPVHTWVFVAETPATCNAAGEREHYKCTCGRTSFKNDDAYDINEDASVLTIEKNSANHTGAPDSKWHSDSANHWQEYTCCYARANEAAHSGGAATCTAQAVCQVCGKAYGPLAAHDWGAWKVTTPATKDAPGVETRTCAHNSAHTETRSIPKLSTTVYTVSEDTKIAQIEAKVEGLDKILESNENKALVNDGKSVGVSLTVKNTASSGVSEKIKEKLAGSNLVGLRLELTVEKTVTENGAVVERENIPDTGVLLRTTITLPAELQGKSGYVVYRLHGDAVHVLTETANENREFISVSADKTQITICARLYSEYVIAYQTGGSSGGGYYPVNPKPVKATSANTGDAGVLLYGVTAALSLTGTAWLGAKSRKH